MASLAFMKYDHSTASIKPTLQQTALLCSPFDLICVKADGWQWGDAELSHPWFRIVLWSQISVSAASAFLGPLLPVLDKNGIATTLPQARAFHLDLASTAIPASFRTWWADDTRAVPIFTVPGNFPTPTALQLARAAIPDPNYTGIVTAPVVGGISA